MSRRHLDRLATPKPEFDLAKIMRRAPCKVRSERAGKPVIVGFETRALAKAEDAKRLSLAQSTLRAYPKLINTKLVKRLISALAYDGDQAPHSRASSLRSRTLRRKLTGAILELIETSGVPVRGLTLLSQQWVIPADRLRPKTLRRIKKIVQNYIDRLGKKRGDGFVILGFDGDYDQHIDAYPIHMHGIVGGDYIVAFDRLIRRLKAFTPTDYIARPLRMAELKDPAKQVSYIVKGFWKAFNSAPDEGSRMHPRRARRIPEPYGTIYLAALNDLAISETIIMSGLDIIDGKFSIRQHID